MRKHTHTVLAQLPARKVATLLALLLLVMGGLAATGNVLS